MTRRHYPRFDTTICPDSEDCERRYHGLGGPEAGDCCECCGRVVDGNNAQEVTWRRIAATVKGGPTVYWDGTTPSGWRLAVSRVDFDTPGSPWLFKAYRPWPHSKAGEKVHESDGIGTVAQARKAAEVWLAASLPQA